MPPTRSIPSYTSAAFWFSPARRPLQRRKFASLDEEEESLEGTNPDDLSTDRNEALGEDSLQTPPPPTEVGSIPSTPIPRLDQRVTETPAPSPAKSCLAEMYLEYGESQASISSDEYYTCLSASPRIESEEEQDDDDDDDEDCDRMDSDYTPSDESSEFR